MKTFLWASVLLVGCSGSSTVKTEDAGNVDSPSASEVACSTEFAATECDPGPLDCALCVFPEGRCRVACDLANPQCPASMTCVALDVAYVGCGKTKAYCAK